MQKQLKRIPPPPRPRAWIQTRRPYLAERAGPSFRAHRFPDGFAQEQALHAVCGRFGGFRREGEAHSREIARSGSRGRVRVALRQRGARQRERQMRLIGDVRVAQAQRLRWGGPG